jgi:Ca-activated chloride channel family protein
MMPDAFTLLRPLWLAALPLIAAILVYAAYRTGRAREWERAADAGLLEAMAQRGGIQASTRRRQVAAPLAAAVIAIALSGPAIERMDAASFRNLDATLIIADLSSAATDDARLQRIRITARTIADNAGSRQIGLIVYAGDAYMASTLTTDPSALGSTIAALEADTVPDAGNRPERAFALARHVLRDARVAGGDVVLVSAGDGFGANASGEARALAAAGYKLHTLTVPGAARNGADGEREAALANIAAEGRGMAAVANGLNSDPGGLLKYLSARPAERLGSGSFAALVWNDIGRGILILAAIAALLTFRRRAA